MRNIIQLIQKYKNFLFFLLLEFFAIFLLFNWRNSFHNSNYLSSSNAISSSLYGFKHNVTSYFNLKKVNDALMIENSFLKDQLMNTDLVVGKRFVKINNSLFYKTYKFQEAKIINSQFKFSENNLLINKGALNGVEPKMGFMGTKGIYGITENVSNHYSCVKPLINANFGLKVIHQKTNSWGDFKWVPAENNYRTAFVENIPIYTKVSKNDYFITTGSDGLFPSGIKVGKVIKYKEDKELQTLKITIELEEDYSNANVGFVVKNLFSNEIKELNE